MKNDFAMVGLLCSWGIHLHNKQIVLTSPDIDLKLVVNICPICKHPKKKTLKMLFGKGNYRINKELFQELLSFLKNVSTGQSYGENPWSYRTKTAKNLLIDLQGESKVNEEE